MAGRWGVLALLFAVRSTMAFQFQSVAALAPLFGREFGVGLADIGLLIGLYLAPGIALALPGGAVGQRYGDKTVVLVGLALMIGGGLLMALSNVWALQLVGRLAAGIGGVLLNVLMSKMVTDWFAGREIATAMAIFVNSWPFGIALALVLLPPMAMAFGMSIALLFTVGLIGIGLLALAVLYREPPHAASSPTATIKPVGNVLVAVVLAGLVWGLYNASLGMIFSFGPSMLAEQNWTLAAASSTTSIVLWLVAVSVPLGGYLADRTGQHGAVLVGSCLAFAALLLLATRTQMVLPTFVALGLVSGLAAGPIMSLPAKVLAPEARAVGMGVFYALFYVLVVLAPWLGGAIAGAAGTARATFDLGAAMLLLSCAAVWAFNKASAQITGGEPAVHATNAR